MKKWEMQRRTFLKGAGVAIGLPFLEAMLPFTERAMAQGIVSPLRVVFLYKPNGEKLGSWNALANGAFPYVLEPFNALKNDVTIIQGMRNRNSDPYDDGHAPRVSTFLTMGPITQSTSTVNNVKSADLIIAETKGVKSLVLGGPSNHGTDNTFNGEYFSNLSWTGPRAAPKIIKPRDLFDMLFSGAAPVPPAQANARALGRKSILDYALGEANRTMASLGQSDKHKLDEYLTSVREIEKGLGQLDQANQQVACEAPGSRPADKNSFQIHTQLMFDLLAKALQCGQTQVASYILAPEVSDDINSHHSTSHWTESASNLQRYLDTNRWYASQVAAFLQKLKNTQEANGTLLSNSMILYANGLGDGDSHEGTNLPLLLAGQAQGKLHPGKYLQKKGMPHANLILSMMNIMGVSRASFGDSSGILTDI